MGCLCFSSFAICLPALVTCLAGCLLDFVACLCGLLCALCSCLCVLAFVVCFAFCVRAFVGCLAVLLQVVFLHPADAMVNIEIQSFCLSDDDRSVLFLATGCAAQPRGIHQVAKAISHALRGSTLFFHFLSLPCTQFFFFVLALYAVFFLVLALYAVLSFFVLALYAVFFSCACPVRCSLFSCACPSCGFFGHACQQSHSLATVSQKF